MGDVNYIVMFLAHFPYHPTALLLLADIYAHMGRLDRASDLIRRTLYIAECSFLESFKPTTGLCRMDPFLRENESFFNALFRHMQVASMQACHTIASDVCRLMLSLHPTDEKFNLLLWLDSLLVAAHQHELIKTYCGLQTQQTQETDSVQTDSCDIHVGKGDSEGTNTGAVRPDFPTDFLGTHPGEAMFISPYRFELFDGYKPSFASAVSTCSAPTTSTGSSSARGAVSDGSGGSGDASALSGGSSVTMPATGASASAISAVSAVSNTQFTTGTGAPQKLLPLSECVAGSGTIENLPNWWFSLALAYYQAEFTVSQRVKHTSGSGSGSAALDIQREQQHLRLGLAAARHVLKCALLRWPFMLEPLMHQSGIDVGLLAASTMAPWKKLFSHPLFAGAAERLPNGMNYLRKLSEVYAMRNTAIWGREDVLKWVLESAEELVGEISTLNAPYSVTDVTTRQRQLYVELCDPDYHLAKYEDANTEDFKGEFSRLPEDAAPIDPMLDDPGLLNGGMRFQNFMDTAGRFVNDWDQVVLQQQQQQNMMRDWWGGFAWQDGGEGGVHDDDDDDDDLDDHGAAVDAVAGEGGFRRGGRRRRGGRVRPVPNIDLNLPLMQLFLATLFPWIHVPRLDRH